MKAWPNQDICISYPDCCVEWFEEPDGVVTWAPRPATNLDLLPDLVYIVWVEAAR